MSESKTKRFRLAVLLSGKGSNFRALAEAIRRDSLPIDVVLVISDQSQAAGLKSAEDLGIATTVVRRLPKERSNAEFNSALAEALSEKNPDLIVLAGFMRVLTPELISKFPGRIINIHPSLLPSFKGLHGQRQALDAGVKFSGCTVHVVVEELDSGPILAQAVVPVLAGDTEETLTARILREEHKLLPAVVRALVSGEIRVMALPSRKVIVERDSNVGRETDALRSIE